MRFEKFTSNDLFFSDSRHDRSSSISEAIFSSGFYISPASIATDLLRIIMSRIAKIPDFVSHSSPLLINFQNSS